MRRVFDIPLVRLYFVTERGLAKLVSFLRLVFVSFWLGVLSRRMLHRIDDYFFRAEEKYCDPTYNQSGLFNWEQQVVQTYFMDCTSLRVASAGGGRELYALHQLGFTVDGFECNAALARYANEIFRAHALPIHVEATERDICPVSTHEYDGFVIGWGGFTLIQGRNRRIAFLKQVYNQVKADGPVLLSFFHRPSSSGYFRLVVRIANTLRGRLGYEQLELGDNLRPTFVHHFTEDELRGELQDAGFDLIYYGTVGAAHAVARKRAG